MDFFTVPTLRFQVLYIFWFRPMTVGVFSTAT
jgi:hypothetical protein